MTRIPALFATASVLMLAAACDLTVADRPDVVEPWGGDGMWTPEFDHEARGDVEVVSGTDVWWEGEEIVSLDGDLVVVDTGPGTCDFDIDAGYMMTDTYFDADDTEPQDHDGNVVLTSAGRRVFVAGAGDYDVPGIRLPGVVEDARFLGNGDIAATFTRDGQCKIMWTDGNARVLANRFCGGEMVADIDGHTVWLASGADIARVDSQSITVFPQAAEHIAWDASNGLLLAASGDTVSAYGPAEFELDTRWERQFDTDIVDFSGGNDTAVVLTRTDDESEVTILGGSDGEELGGLTTWQRITAVHGAPSGNRFAVRGVNTLHTFDVR